jgi:hypothetical protein
LAGYHQPRIAADLTVVPVRRGGKCERHMKFNIVYGNHGTNPVGVEGIITYVKACVESAGHRTSLSPIPVMDKINILIDGFCDPFEDIVLNRLQPRPPLILVATENVSPEGYWPGATAPFIEKQARFTCLRRISRSVEAVWCMLPQQVDQYKYTFGIENVFCLPHGYVDGYYGFDYIDECDRDIDFFFSGSMTEYRQSIMDRLSSARFNCVSLDPGVSNFIRNEAISRSKICLALRQEPNWPSPSISRIHHHLMAQSFVSSEKCEDDSVLDPYIEVVEPDYLHEICIETIVRGGTAGMGALNHQRFRRETDVTQAVAAILEASAGGF